MEVDQLSSSDLPHMEEYNRKAGADKDLRSSFTQNQGVELPTSEGKITKWMLVKNLWKGRGTTIFISMSRHSLQEARLMPAFCVETTVTCFSYLQIYSMHEIISSFDDPSSESDRAYARLMCWGLFVGQSTECILSAYSWRVT